MDFKTFFALNFSVKIFPKSLKILVVVFIIINYVLAPRKLEDDYVLLEGKLRAPVKHLREKRPYKYIVLRVKKHPKPYVWERLFRCGPYRNRCLNVPRDYCTSGGQISY